MYALLLVRYSRSDKTWVRRKKKKDKSISFYLIEKTFFKRN